VNVLMHVSRWTVENVLIKLVADLRVDRILFWGGVGTSHGGVQGACGGTVRKVEGK